MAFVQIDPETRFRRCPGVSIGVSAGGQSQGPELDPDPVGGDVDRARLDPGVAEGPALIEQRDQVALDEPADLLLDMV